MQVLPELAQKVGAARLFCSGGGSAGAAGLAAERRVATALKVQKFLWGSGFIKSDPADILAAQTTMYFLVLQEQACFSGRVVASLL